MLRAGSRLPDIPELPQMACHIHDGTTDGMIRLVAEAKPDVVFHLASLFLAQHESKDLVPLIQSNILFGSQLLEAMHANSVTNLINTGTSWQHYNNETYNPVCLYAATKQAFEDILIYYANACSIKSISLQLFDTYGPGDSRPKLFQLLANAASNQNKLSMSPGEQLLDLVYIDDVIEAYLCAERALNNMRQGHQIYAVSSAKSLSLREIVSEYERVSGIKLCIGWGERPYRPREVMNTWNTGASLPGWSPNISLAEGIRNCAIGSRLSVGKAPELP